jgi:hypothetical protein
MPVPSRSAASLRRGAFALLGLVTLAACQETPSAPDARDTARVGPRFSLVSPSDTDVVGDVTYILTHGTFRFWNGAITSTSNGFVSGDTAFVLPGASITMQAEWEIGPVTDVSVCPYCIIEVYAAWDVAAKANGATPVNTGLWMGINDVLNPNPGGDNTWFAAASPFTFTTQAPTMDGEYYVGGEQTLLYDFDGSFAADVAGWPTGGPTSQHAFSFAVIADGTPPVVAYAGNAGTYTVDQTVAITCTATDELSGVVSTTCADISGPAYTFPLGTNSYSAEATDRLGNVGTGSTSFTVSVTNASLCSLVERWVTQGNVAHSLCVKLEHGDYRPFVNEVRAQTGKAIPAEDAAILRSLVAAL